MPAIHHNDSARRFPAMSHGDITAWTRATTGARRPESGGRAQPSAPITNIAALRASAVASVFAVAHNPITTVIPFPSKLEGVAEEMKKCAKSAKISDDCHRIGSFFANLYGTLGK